MARRKHRSGSRSLQGTKELPEQLEGTLSQQLGDELPQLKESLLQTAPVSIRINPWKNFDPGGDQVPWCSAGRYLDERPAFTFDPLLHAGAYYVQEASSMFLEKALQASGLMDRDMLALDLCAAPGGKSTHLRSLLTPGSLLVANEIDRQRQPALQENLWKWGFPNVIIAGSDPKDLAGLPGFFDLIVVDAPCSGEGMFRKDPFAREQWSPELVKQCVHVQRGILDHAWHALSPGGILIYCTCTWETGENELQLEPLLAKGGQPIEIPLENPSIERSGTNGLYGCRFYPHRLKGEGFFLGMIRKPGEPSDRKFPGNSKQKAPTLPFLRDQEHLFITDRNGIQHALDDRWSAVSVELGSVLRTLAPGIPVAERKGTEWKPHAALALNQLLEPNGLPQIELSLQEAIEYLKGQALPVKGERGTAIATHRGLPLGWLQGAGNRWNNRWPLPWRIRSHEAATGEVAWAQHS